MGKYSKKNLQEILLSVRKELKKREITFYFNGSYHRFLRLLKEIPLPPLDILEVGTSPGHLSTALRKLGYSVHGVDYDPERHNERWKEYDIIVEKCNIEEDNFPFSDRSFDIVIFSEVLEHLIKNPLFPLKEMHRVLKKNGSLILTTPNSIKLLNRLKLLFGKSIYTPIECVCERPIYERHNREYAMNEVKWLCEQAGFRIIKAEYFSAHQWLTPVMGPDIPIGYSAYSLEFRLNSLRQLAKIPYFLLYHLFPNIQSALLVKAQKPGGC